MILKGFLGTSNMQILLLALIIGASSAAILNPDAIVPEGVEELPSDVRPASREEEAFLEEHTESVDRVVMLPPSEVFSQKFGHFKDRRIKIGKLKIPTRHERSGWVCWETGTGTKCAQRKLKRNSRLRNHLTQRDKKNLKASKKKKNSASVEKHTKAEKKTKEHRQKKLAEMQQNRMAIAKIHCKKKAVGCKKKRERLIKAQEKNQKILLKEKKAKTEMKLADKEKRNHEKLMEHHEKRHAKLKVLSKAKSERFGKSQEKLKKMSAKEALAKKEMKVAKKEKKEHEKKMEKHNKKRAKLAKLAKKKYARLMKAQAKAKNLTAREAKSKAEVAHAFNSAKKAKGRA